MSWRIPSGRRGLRAPPGSVPRGRLARAPPTPGPSGRRPPRPPPPAPRGLTLPGKGPGRSSFSACLFSSTRRALQFSHQTPRSEPGEEPPPLPEPGEPVPKPGEPPREPGELVPMPGEAGPGEPVKELGDEVPEPGDGVPDEPSAEPAPSGVGLLPARDSSYAFRYQLSGEKGAAGLVGEQTSFTCGGDVQSQGPQGGGLPRPRAGLGRAGGVPSRRLGIRAPPRARPSAKGRAFGTAPNPAAESAYICPVNRPLVGSGFPGAGGLLPGSGGEGPLRGFPGFLQRDPYSQRPALFNPTPIPEKAQVQDAGRRYAGGGGGVGGIWIFIHSGYSPPDPEGKCKALPAPGQ